MKELRREIGEQVIYHYADSHSRPKDEPIAAKLEFHQLTVDRRWERKLTVDQQDFGESRSKVQNCFAKCKADPQTPIKKYGLNGIWMPFRIPDTVRKTVNMNPWKARKIMEAVEDLNRSAVDPMPTLTSSFLS